MMDQDAPDIDWVIINEPAASSRQNLNGANDNWVALRSTSLDAETFEVESDADLFDDESRAWFASARRANIRLWSEE